jgi:hypothetical protein
VIEHAATHEIVGHHGVICLSFTNRGKPIYVGKTENTFVLTQHSGNFFYPGFEKAVLNNMKDRFDFIYTTASNKGRGAVGVIRKRLGYVSIGKRACFCLYADSRVMKKLIKLRFPAVKSVSGLISYMHSVVQYAAQADSYYQSRNIEIIPLTWRDVGEVEGFWKKNKRFYGITADRSANFFTWRFAKNPHGKHYLIKLVKGLEVIGYAVLKKKKIIVDEVGFETSSIEDLIVAEATEKKFHLAIAAVTRFASKTGMVLIIVLKQDDPINSAIQRFLGPLRKLHAKEGPEFLVWGKPERRSLWYYTNILAEGGGYDVSYQI